MCIHNFMRMQCAGSSPSAAVYVQCEQDDSEPSGSGMFSLFNM